MTRGQRVLNAIIIVILLGFALFVTMVATGVIKP